MSTLPRVVWKFEIGEPDRRGRVFVQGVPEDAEFLSVGMQGDKMVVWAAVSKGAKGPRRLIVVNTGHSINFPEGARFVGTVTANDIVWHVFDGDAETTA